MSLSGFTPKTETVKYPDGDFAVRGLSLDDITSLVALHYAALSALFDKYIAEGVAAAVLEGTGNDDDVTQVIMDLAQQAPVLIADVIAHAADERDQAATARLLPISTQVEAIETVLRLTLLSEGGLEKLVATVTRLGTQLQAVTEDRAA